MRRKTPYSQVSDQIFQKGRTIVHILLQFTGFMIYLMVLGFALMLFVSS